MKKGGDRNHGKKRGGVKSERLCETCNEEFYPLKKKTFLRLGSVDNKGAWKEKKTDCRMKRARRKNKGRKVRIKGGKKNLFVYMGIPFRKRNGASRLRKRKRLEKCLVSDTLQGNQWGCFVWKRGGKRRGNHQIKHEKRGLLWDDAARYGG